MVFQFETIFTFLLFLFKPCVKPKGTILAPGEFEKVIP